MATMTAITESDRLYLAAIRIRLERLYDEHPNDPFLREQISDEVSWIDEKLEAAPIRQTSVR